MKQKNQTVVAVVLGDVLHAVHWQK